MIEGQRSKSPPLLVIQSWKGPGECHQEACGTARSLPPSRFNSTAASKLRQSQPVPSPPEMPWPGPVTCPPHVWQGSHVFPGPGEKFGDLGLWGDSKAALLFMPYCLVSQRVSPHVESPSRTPCLVNACQTSVSKTSAQDARSVTK